MKFCEQHWLDLRTAIDARGLTPFIAKDGKVATQQLVKQLEGNTGKATFDPLMSAHWAIATNAMETLSQAGINPLYLMNDDASAPEGRNNCPLCELNYLHKTSCTDSRCQLDKEKGYDWMIERAAEDSLEQARKYGLIA